jgi:formate dehydrogenase iron-sulfur subunit
MSRAMLIDTTKCIGCRSCQVSCKEWNDLPAEKTSLPAADLGLQNPRVLSAKTLVVVTDHEIEDSDGRLHTIFAKRQCMHCDEPACVSACPVTAMHKTPEGPVVYDKSKCIGCRYCMWACPWSVPTAQWDSLAPKISKCTMCYDRIGQKVSSTRNGQAITAEQKASHATGLAEPLCIKQCPAGALKYGERAQLLSEAKQRIKKSAPGSYVNHIYGEHEAGGTGVLYLASVPFEQIGFPKVQTEALPHISAMALGAVPPAVIGVGAVLGGVFALKTKRSAEVAKAEKLAVNPKQAKADHHVEFAPVKGGNLFSPVNLLLMFLMAFGGISFLLRFALGLGGSTNLSDTWAWGLWIVFDFVWISIAAGAFATAGLIYVFKREELYSMGRSAVLMGLLSYSFVVLTLVADLGLPWHFYALGMNSPKHSAMFEVSWCIFFYLTVLALEFLPSPLEGFGLDQKWKAMWVKYSPMYVVFAVSLFVYLMSRNLLYTVAAFAVFAFMAYAFRQKEDEKPVPIMLAIAAVTLSTMHQSSLGSLFLLMPDKLDHLWWSPVMPVCYFLSSIAAGTALMVLVEMWIAKAFKRSIRMEQLASMGKVSFLALLVYLTVRLVDVAVRGQGSRILNSPHSALFLIEIVALGFVPLVMLAIPGLRKNPVTLGLATFLSVSGIIWNRTMGVIFAMTLTGPMPQTVHATYIPSIWEWGICIGMLATTIFLFEMGVRYIPVLPKEGEASVQFGD